MPPYLSLFQHVSGCELNKPPNNVSVCDGLRTSQARFPAQAEQIQKLFETDDSFKGLCEDLAAAEQALRSVDRFPIHLREVRREEYQSLVESLLGEIREELSRSKIIAFSRLPKT